MPSDTSTELGRLLMSYSGPEPGRVRTAIAKLAKDDLEKMAYFVGRAQDDYRDVLWWVPVFGESQLTGSQSVCQ